MLLATSKTVSVVDHEERKIKIQEGGSGEKKLREKMVVEGEDDSWTLDCLRRRLLAERNSSKTAKEEAEHMGRKLIELEKQLKLEIETRDRAEKTLKLATKKLESLKLSAVVCQLSSLAREGSSSSSTCSSGLQESDERNSAQMEEKGKHQMEEKIRKVTGSLISEEARIENSATVAANAVNEVPCNEHSSSSVDSANFHNNEDDSQEAISRFEGSFRSIESATGANRESSVDGEEVEPARYQMENADDTLAIVPEENPLAIVPANMWPESKDYAPSINDSVHDVLLALQHAKEQLQSSMRIGGVHSQSFGMCGG